MLTAFLVLALIGSLVALVLALNTLISLFRDKVPYVSTPRWAIDWLRDNVMQYSPLLAKERGGGEVSPPSLQGGGRGAVYDLGCGDARVLIAIKQRYPTITAIGYERNWWPFILAKARIRGTGVKVYRQNFYQADLRNADVVFCFLIHSVMPKVETLLRSQLAPGATVYSYGFSFPTWKPSRRIENPTRPQGSKLNIYTA
ncbi:MAG: class I SAM-dependent methyltransferase [Candidatus Kerfeldbacteria bacterium]